MIQSQPLNLPAALPAPLAPQRERLGRAPAWRWAWAERAVRESTMPPVPDAACATALQLCQHLTGHRAIPATLQTAYGAYQRARAGDLPCWELEARLLAGQPDTSISRAAGVTGEFVRAFHDLFYDVRDRRDHSAAMWALLCVGEAARQEVAAAGFLKRHAYFWGPAGVVAALRWWQAPPDVPPWDPPLPASLWEDLRERWLVEIHFLASQAPPGPPEDSLDAILATVAIRLRQADCYRTPQTQALLTGLAAVVGHRLPALGRPYALIPTREGTPVPAGTAVVLAGASSAG